MRGLLLVVSGPSGVGKGTVLEQVLKANDNIFYSVSATTRPKRPGDVDGVQYYFLTHEEFEKRIAEGRMLEYASYCGNYYGTPRDAVENMLAQGKDVLLEIEPCGAMQVMEKCPDAVSIFILPPSMDELRARLTGRGTEAQDVIEKRLAKAEEEVAFKDRYKYNIVNDTIENAKDQILSIINQNKHNF